MKLLKKIWIIFSVIILLLYISSLFNNRIDVECPDIIENKTSVIKEWVLKIDDKSYNYQLLRLKWYKKPSYAMYIKNKRPEVVLITRPYDQISWSCESVDNKNYFDINKMWEDSNIYLYNGFSVLNVFWRFYDSWDIENDISDMLAGLDYLKWKKVWITWGSWWWFEAIYAAANTENKPVIWTAFYPPTDMESWINWSLTTNEKFFKPYQEKILATTKWNYTKWNHKFLVDNLKTNFLIYHAYEDTLVPVNDTINFSKLTNKVSTIITHKKSIKLSHWEPLSGSVLPIEYSILPIYLMRWLTQDNITIPLETNELTNINNPEIIKILNDEKLIIYWLKENRIMTYEEIKKIINDK